MSLPVSERLQGIRPSPTMAITALAARLREQGRDIISLAAGEPDFDTPAHIREAAIAAIRDGATRYTPVEGTAALEAAIIDKFRRENGLHYRPGQVIASSGAKQSCYNLAMTVLDHGDEAIIPAPCWVSYPDMVRLAGGRPVILPAGLDCGFKLSAGALEAAITARTRLVFFNSPGNPGGAAYTRDEWQALGEVLERHPRVIIGADDIYEHVYWGREPFVSFAAACPSLHERTVTINGVSKAYAMTGWRIGYAAGPVELVAAMKKLQGHSTSNPCSISQAASIAALDGSQDCVRAMAAAFRERHDFLVAALDTVPGMRCIPADGAFYAFPDVAGILERRGLANDHALCMLLLEQAGVATVPGSAFGMPGHIRLSYACGIDTLREAVGRIRKVLG